MSAPQDEWSEEEEKDSTLESLIESEDGLSDNQAIYQKHLSDPDPEVRALAIEGLWHYPDPVLIDPLMELARHDPDPQVRNRAIVGMGRYVYEGEMAGYDYDWGEMGDIDMMYEDELPEADYQRVVAFLLDIARDPSASLDEQRFSIEALGFSSEPEIADLIEQAYQSPHLDMKASALFAMGRSGKTRWGSYILAEIDSPEPQLQYEAVRAAGALFLDEATHSLIRLASYATDPDLRHEAIWALGHMTPLDAWQLLEDIAQDPTEDEETHQVAEVALEEYYLHQQMAEAELEPFDEDEGGNGYFIERRG
jgi:HEAT repeat protein